MSVRHSWRVPIRAPSVPEPAAKRRSKRITATFDPDNEESLSRWRQQASKWSFGSEVDLILQPRVSTNDASPPNASEDNLTFFDNDSEQDMGTTGTARMGSVAPWQHSAFSYDDLPPIAGSRDGGEQGTQGKEGMPPSDTYVALSLPLWREVLFIIVICLAMFTAQVGLGQVLLLLPTIGDAFDISNPGDLGWLIAGYSLTVGTFILVSGRLGDIYGYKRMVVIGYAWYALWSLICGLSIYDGENGYIMFVFARVLAGIGPAITMPNGLAIFGAAYPDGMRKAMAFSLFGACAPSGSIVGGTFAALFDLAWWPWTFFSFAIVLAILSVLCAFVIPSMPSTRAPPKTWTEAFHAFDMAGGVVGVTALILINFAWNQAAVVGWSRDRDYVYICLLLGMILLAVFLVIERWLAREPLVPFSVLTSDVGFVIACIACGWGCFGIWVFYLLQFYMDLRHGSALLTSAWLSPIAVSGFAASVTTGIILAKIRSSFVMVLSMLFFTVGVVLIATAPVDQSYWAQTFVCSIIIPWGMDMSFPAATIIMSNSIPKQHQGVAASLINTVVNYSISIGLGFAATVEREIHNHGATEADRLRGYRGALYLGIGLAGLGLFISLVFAVKQETNERRKRRSTSFRLPDK